MKQLTTFLLILLFPWNIYSQKNVGSFNLDYFKKDYLVTIGLSNVIIQTNNINNANNVVIIDESDVNAFKANLELIKYEYERLINYCDTNNIQDLIEPLNTILSKVNVRWETHENNYSYQQTLKPIFKKNNHGCFIFINEEVISSFYKHRKTEVQLVFSSTKELDELINLLK